MLNIQYSNNNKRQPCLLSCSSSSAVDHPLADKFIPPATTSIQETDRKCYNQCVINKKAVLLLPPCSTAQPVSTFPTCSVWTVGFQCCSRQVRGVKTSVSRTTWYQAGTAAGRVSAALSHAWTVERWMQTS